MQQARGGIDSADPSLPIPAALCEDSQTPPSDRLHTPGAQ